MKRTVRPQRRRPEPVVDRVGRVVGVEPGVAGAGRPGAGPPLLDDRHRVARAGPPAVHRAGESVGQRGTDDPGADDEYREAILP